MSARTLLNAASVNGALLTSAVLGVLTGSILVAAFVFCACVAVAFIAGDIRLQPTNRK
jgi:hypothetical protein